MSVDSGPSQPASGRAAALLLQGLIFASPTNATPAAGVPFVPPPQPNYWQQGAGAGWWPLPPPQPPPAAQPPAQPGASAPKRGKERGKRGKERRYSLNTASR